MVKEVINKTTKWCVRTEMKVTDVVDMSANRLICMAILTILHIYRHQIC